MPFSEEDCELILDQEKWSDCVSIEWGSARLGIERPMLRSWIIVEDMSSRGSIIAKWIGKSHLGVRLGEHLYDFDRLDGKLVRFELPEYL